MTEHDLLTLVLETANAADLRYQNWIQATFAVLVTTYFTSGKINHRFLAIVGLIYLMYSIAQLTAILFLHGRRAFRLTAAERNSLAMFVERGGVIVADAICASPEFTKAFRRELSAIFPASTLARIPPEHNLFTREFGGYELSQVTVRDPQVRAGDDPLKADLMKVSPLLEGLQIDDRYAVIFSPYDISCALENGSSLDCKGYVKDDAARLGINVILFALQQ